MATRPRRETTLSRSTMIEGNMPSGVMESKEDMPSWNMDRPSSGEAMPAGGMGTSRMNGGGDEMQNVLIEVRIPASAAASRALSLASDVQIPGFRVDTAYEPIPMSPPPEAANRLASSDEQTVIIRGSIAADKIAELESQPNIVKVWKDTEIQPFAISAVLEGKIGSGLTTSRSNILTEEVVPVEEEEVSFVSPMEGTAACPIGSCDCAPGVAKGTIAEVATYLGANQIWAAGHRGDGIVVGVVDGGITATGRTPRPGETARIGQVTGGFPADWGTTAAAWGDHGNMCATDVLGMAPNARIYDIRISGGGIAATISAALAGFQWAINQHRTDGTPHILTNSWGIFQESWDPAYARDPNHPFTRKVVEAINEGIVVLFAAGNCGGTCPDGRCGPDSGPGRSIWGANSHPRVITVGAVNKNEQFVGYSSQGPGALDPQKPDFCSVTHFRGYFSSDSGTSAATPIAAGITALLKQGNPSLTHDQIKNVLKSTAKDIGPAGFDQHSGSGIIRPKLAYDSVARPSAWSGWENLGGFCTDGVGVSSWAANRLDTFVIGNDRALWHKWWNGTAWSGWESLGGQLYSAPAAVSWGPNRIDTFALGGNRAMWHKWWNGSSWSGWENLGGFCTDGVGVSSWAANRLDCFVIGNDRALWHKWWNGSSWSAWESLGGHLYSAPAAVSWGNNRIDVFAIGGDHAMWHKWWNGSSWSAWESLGGYCTDGVGVSSWAPNRLDCFVAGNDRALWHKWWNGSSWSGWESLGGQIYSAPAAVSWGTNRIDAFALGANRAMWHKWWA